MDLAIDATHLHPSTALSLSALEWLQGRISPASVLDMGAGSGILSLTSNHLWNCPVLACDISEKALADMAENIARFAPDAPISTLRSDGFTHPKIRSHAPFELILGNLLAQWQVAMARDIKACLATGGHVVLSGIMLWQAEGLRQAFAILDIHVIQEFTQKEWVCYILRHTEGARA